VLDDPGTRRAYDTDRAVIGASRRPGSCRQPLVAGDPRLVRGTAGQRLALQLQRTIGNRALQRLVFDTQKTADEVKRGTKKPFHDRPNEPHREVELEKTIFHGEDVQQSRHHIIPWNTLSAFVRKAYETGHIEHVSAVLGTAIGTMMRNSPRYNAGVRGQLPTDTPGGTAMQGALTLDDLTQELGKTSGAANKEAVWAVTSAFCWMPGNLFLGPLNTLRLDDPDEDFESHAQEQVGERFPRFRQAFDDIKAYVADPKPEVAKRIAAFLKEVAGQAKPIPFDERVWTRVENENGEGRYYLNRAANTVEVKAALTQIRSARAARHQAMIEEHNAWHAAQQVRWTREAEARKAAK
jgi:hypothetical protein